MKPIIAVNNLSKQYRLGGRALSLSLRERINEIIGAPLKRAQRSESATEGGLHWALKDINFTVEPGEVVGIIGRNGSGKSTLLKLLSLITQPTKGEVELFGRFGSLLEVGTGFHPELTGRENVFLNGAILGMSREEIKRHFEEIVAFAEVDAFIDTPVKRYSSGMYLRLAFAVAAHLRTEILLIDEVLTVGDVEFQKKCLGKVEGMAQDGRTVLLVSHNMGAIIDLCPRTLWLNRGRLEMDGASRAAVSGYFGKSFSGSHSWKRAAQEERQAFETEMASSDALLKEASLRSVQICQEGRTAVGAVSFDKDFTIEINYEVRVAASGLRVVLRLISELGVVVFSSHDTDTAGDWKSSARAAGHYVSACQVPGNLLRTGKHFVTIGIMRQGRWVELEENVLLFEVTAIGNFLDPGRKGVITPVLEWSIRASVEQQNGNGNSKEAVIL